MGGIDIGLKEKIYVCLPSYNEAKNIRKITKKIDKSFRCFRKKYNCVIVNADNNSKDGTNNIFNRVKTETKKISIVDSRIGKGINIINFIELCKKDNVKYAIMIDSDVISLKKDCIKMMINTLEKGNDFVIPLYKRKRFEGNTTNHFIVPLIYSLYGIKIRQPICRRLCIFQRIHKFVL